MKILVKTLLAISLVSGPCLAQVGQEELASISVPDSVETPIGTLRYEQGVPTQNTADKVYDYLDQMRGVQSYLDNQGAASMFAMRRGLASLGATKSNQVVIHERPMDANARYLVANSQTVYIFSFLDLKTDGPTVVEIPPNTLGIWNDAWQLYLADFGYVGADQGKGGKYLILPPGFAGEVPDGYHVVQSSTYYVWQVGRGFLQDGDPAPAVANIKANLRIYPLYSAGKPPQMEFIDASGKSYNTISSGTFQFFEDINQVVQHEPIESLGPERRGVLRAIGIEKGKDFQPDQRMRRILGDAASIGNASYRSLWWRPRADTNALYKDSDSHWMNGYPDRNTTFIDAGAMLLDARTQMYIIGTGVTPAMATVEPGKGSDYTFLFLDGNGDRLDGAKSYRLRFPADIPVANFWSIIVYDAQTRSFLPTSQPGSMLSSVFDGVQQNPDGSTDIYFGPQAPAGKGANWLETVPGKSWFICLRMYGARQPWLDQSWRPGEIEPQPQGQ